MSEHEYEPVRGLPGRLPPGETIIWQGAPEWRPLAKRALHTHLVGGYFAVLAGWAVITAVADATPLRPALQGIAITVAIGVAAVALLGLFAWLAARSTVYTITTRRVVLRFGVALPKCINLPFTQIASAGLQVNADGTGDLPLALTGPDRVGYLRLWPHARPWRIGTPEPMLRSIAEPEAVAALLATALADAVPGRRGAISGLTAAEVFAPNGPLAA